MFKKILIIILSFTITSLAYSKGFKDIYKGMAKKQEEKNKVRWTLFGWLGTKKKMALMDQWLASNSSSSSLFEMSLEAHKGDLDFTNGTPINEKSFERYSGSLYMRFFGLSYNKERVGPDLSSSSLQANLLLLGSSNQSTNIQAFFGLRKLTYLTEEFSPKYWGAKSNLYILPFLGGFYDYRKYLSSSEGAFSLSGGDRHEFGAFVEVWLLRIKGTFIRERLDFSGPSIAGRPNWKGAFLGAELFF